MADENLTPSEPAINNASEGQRPALLDVLRMALTCPEVLTASSLEPLSHALRLDEGDQDRCALAVAALAALLYSRPELVDLSLVYQLTDLLKANGLPKSIGYQIAKVFDFVASSPMAPQAWSHLFEMLRKGLLPAANGEWIFPVITAFVQWREDTIGLDDVIALAQSPVLADFRSRLFEETAPRFVFSRPAAFTPERLGHIASMFADAPSYPYFLYTLAARPSLAANVRSWAAQELEGHFPYHKHAAAILRTRPLKLLVVLNVGMGQGDDVVRIAPLFQGLLDANPAVTITLVTMRTYLYDNSRVTTLPFSDKDAVAATLEASFEGVIEFFQPEWPDFTFNIDLHTAIERYLAEHDPVLVIKGDLGRVSEGFVGGRLAFLYQTVKIGGIEIAQSRRLDQCEVRNIYEPTMRLLAELGLPQRAGEETPPTLSVLTGLSSADAQRVWAELVAPEPGSAKRPVVLLNPFGGSGITKGFLEQDELLAAEIAGLVDEGFLVILLPNGQKWGRRAAIDAVISRLDADVRANIRVAPDPAESDESVRVALHERPALEYRDRVMRMFKYFATYADLIVTAEGWLAHLAFNLGRPLRLFLAAGSFSSEYHPRLRGPRQRVVPVLSPTAAPVHSQSALLREGDPPPLPHRPRKSLLEVALTGLGRGGDARDLAPIRLASKSLDPEVRTWAIAALGRILPFDAKAELLAALQDRWPRVSREAAQALVAAGVDCRRELGSRYRDLLQAYVDIDKQDWEAVARLGPLVLPALFKAAESDVHDVKHGAKELLRKMLSPFVHSPGAQKNSSVTSL